jgi:hypothetical protein
MVKGFSLARLIAGSLLALLLMASSAYSQDSSSGNGNQTGNGSQNGNGSQSGNGAYIPPTMPSPLDQSFTASLASGQAIPLNSAANAQLGPEGQSTAGAPEMRSQFLYGGTLSSVYMQDYGTTSIDHLVSGVVSPYVGLYLPTRTGGVTLQYLGEYAPDDAFSNNFQAYHTLAFSAVGAFTRRWFWGLSSTANYGSDSVQFEAPLPYLMVDMIPVVDPVEPAEFFIGRTVALADNSAEIGWRRTEHDRFTLTAFHAYSDISSSQLAGGLPATQSNAVGANLDYARDVNSRFKFDVYAQDEHVIESNCNMYGGGAGISAQLSYSWHLDANGGPEWTSANCGQKVNYNVYGALVKGLRGHAQAYLVGWQYYNVAFLTPNTWETAVAAGFSQPVGHNWSVEGAAGWFRGNPLVSTTTALEGYFVAPQIRYKLTESTSITAGYRVFHATSGGTVPGNLNFASISLEWHPKPFQFGR